MMFGQLVDLFTTDAWWVDAAYIALFFLAAWIIHRLARPIAGRIVRLLRAPLAGPKKPSQSLAKPLKGAKIRKGSRRSFGRVYLFSGICRSMQCLWNNSGYAKMSKCCRYLERNGN